MDRMSKSNLLKGICFCLFLSSVFCLLFSSVPTATAAIPKYINFQGKLTDDIGNPVADGSYSITFRLYSAQTGGTALWTETQSVTVSGGVFNVALGTETALTLAFNTQYWLSVQVGSDTEMTPRQRITAAGYALNADNLDTYTSGQFLRSDAADVYNEDGTNIDLRFEGDSEQNLFFLDASADRIGIGTSTPSEELDVVGDVQISQNLTVSSTVSATYFSGDGSSLTNLGAATIDDDSLDWAKFKDAMELDATTTVDMDTNAADLNFDSTTLFIDSDADRIGIGTSTPSAKLDVQGAVVISSDLTVSGTITGTGATVISGTTADSFTIDVDDSSADVHLYFDDTSPGGEGAQQTNVLEYIMYDDDARAGKGEFVVSKPMRVLGGSASSITLHDGTNSQSITFDSAVADAISIDGNAVVSGDLTISGASAALFFGDDTYQSSAGITTESDPTVDTADKIEAILTNDPIDFGTGAVDAAAFTDDGETISADTAQDKLDSTLATGFLKVATGTGSLSSQAAIAIADTNLVASTGLTLDGDGFTLSTNDSEIVHDNLSGFVDAEHIDWTATSSSLSTTGTLAAADAAITGDLTISGTATVSSDLTLSGASAALFFGDDTYQSSAGITTESDPTVDTADKIEAILTNDPIDFGTGAVDAAAFTDDGETISADTAQDKLDSTLATGFLKVATGTGSLSSQAAIAIADTNLVASTGLTLDGDGFTLSTNDSEIVHDNLSGFVDAEHIDWTATSSSLSTTGTLAAADAAITGDLTISGTATVSSDLTVSGTSAALYLGTDTNLYRSAASTLKTDDSFVVGGTLSATGGISEAGGWSDDGDTVRLTAPGDNVGIGTATADEKLTVSGDASITSDLTVSGAYFGDGSNLTGLVAGEWTQAGTVLHPNDSGSDNVAIGGTTASAPIYLGVGGNATFTSDLTIGGSTFFSGQGYNWPAAKGSTGQQATLDAAGNITWAAAEGTGGAPTDVDYLVGTADGTLSNEIVVGATPGGELGGTWASPSVDSGIHDDEYIELTDNFVGDVTGTYDATVVTDDSHSHTTTTISGLVLADDLNTFTSADLAGKLTDETGSGALVFATSPTFTTSAGIVEGAPTGVELYVAGKVGISSDLTLGGTLTAEVSGAAIDPKFTFTDNKVDIAGAVETSSDLTLSGTTARLYFGSDTNLYRSAANTLKTDDNLVVAGTVSFSDDLTLSGTNMLYLADGTAAAPSLTFKDDTGLNTGLYRLEEDKIGLITGGTATQGVTIDASGQVGIGTTSPTSKLDVSGAITAGGSGTSIFAASVTIGSDTHGSVDLGTTGATADLYIADGLEVDGTAYLDGDALVGTDLGVVEAAPTGVAFYVAGDAGISGDLTVGGTLVTTGNTTFSNDLTISGTTTVTSDLTMSGTNMLYLADGSASAPSLTFKNDMNTGLFRPTGAPHDTLGIATGGTDTLRFSHDGTNSEITAVNGGDIEVGSGGGNLIVEAGNLGIGDTSPSAKLSVSGDATISSDLTLGGTLTAEVSGTDPVFNFSDSKTTITGAVEVSSDLTISGTSAGLFFGDDTYQTSAGVTTELDPSVDTADEIEAILTNDPIDFGTGSVSATGMDAGDGSITNAGDIALDSISSDDGTGVQFKQFKTVADNDGITLTTADAGQTITVDAGGAQTVVLPSVAATDVGIWFRIVKLGAGQVTIDAVDSDTIADSGAGDTIYCAIAGEDYATITIQLAAETEWCITGAHGTWVTTD